MLPQIVSDTSSPPSHPLEAFQGSAPSLPRKPGRSPGPGSWETHTGDKGLCLGLRVDGSGSAKVYLFLPTVSAHDLQNKCPLVTER